MKKIIRNKMHLIPCFLLLGTFASCFLDYNFIFLGNVLGYSILTNVVFIGVFTFGNFCIFTKLAPIGLLAINIVDIIGIYLSNFTYIKIFTIIICSIILFLAIVFKMEKIIYNGK